MFDQGHQMKKESVMNSLGIGGEVSTESNLSIHKTTISSFSLGGGELLTSDLAGFIKKWKL